MDKIVARHLAVDMYGCKPETLQDDVKLRTSLPSILEQAGFHILSAKIRALNDEHTTIMIILHEGHFSLHLYSNIAYVAADLFLCVEGAAPEKLLQNVRGLFHPEKFRTTYLRRGDFTSTTDLKPQVKTHVAPLRRIHNTGAKVIRLLAHRRHS